MDTKTRKPNAEELSGFRGKGSKCPCCLRSAVRTVYLDIGPCTQAKSWCKHCAGYVETEDYRKPAPKLGIDFSL